MKLKRILLLALLSLLTLPLLAKSLYVQQYSIDKGLSSSSVFGVVEDNNGILWISTLEGVDKFDGLNFYHYDLPDIGTNGLRDYMEFHISRDSRGNIWVASRTGLIYKYDALSDSFTLQYSFQRDVTLPAQVQLRSMLLDHRDNIIAVLNNGVWIKESDKESFEKVVNGTTLTTIIQDADHNYLLGFNNGVKVLDLSFNTIHTYTKPESWAKHRLNICKLHIDPTRKLLYVATNRSGVFTINLESGDFIRPKELDQYRDTNVRDICEIDNGVILLGIHSIGVVFWDLTSRKIINKIPYQGSALGTISSNAIYGIDTNSDGVVFISTHRGGLNAYNPNKIGFRHIESFAGAEESLKNKFVLSIVELDPSTIAFGTCDGISIYNRETDKWSQIDSNVSVSDVVTSFAIDSMGDIWANSFANSMMHYSRRGQGFHFEGYIKEFKNIKSNCVCVDECNDVWFSDYDALYRKRRGHSKIDRIPINNILSITPLNKDILAIGTIDGLNFFDRNRFKFCKFDFLDSIEADLKLIKSLKVDSQGRLWAGCKTSGIFVIDIENGALKHIDQEAGLASNHIFAIAPTRDEVWVSTMNGISCIDKDFNVTNYTKSDGIASIDFNYNAALASSDGTLYFGTNDGVITFKPYNEAFSAISKKVILSKCSLNNQRIIPHGGGVIEGEINAIEELELKYNQNSFSFDFDVVDFIHPELGVYRWRLEGFDNDWVYSTTNQKVEYTNIPPGKYTFIFEIEDEHNKVVSNRKSIAISISQPWWRSPLAYIAYILTLILSVVAAVRLYYISMTSKVLNLRLDMIIDLAHEIKTPVQLIKASIQDLLESDNISGAAQKSANIALSNTERLHKQLIVFLDMGNLTQIKTSISYEYIDLHKLLYDKVIYFKTLAEKRGVTLSMECEQGVYIHSDTNILDKILNNLITNAIKYNKENGSVVIKALAANGKCRLQVIDSGIGIVKSQRKNIFKPFYRTPRGAGSGSTGNGIGLVLASNMAQMVNGELILLSSGANGSTFEFSLPYDGSLPATSTPTLATQTAEEEEAKDEAASKILLVEDDKSLLEYSISKLSKKYHIVTACNGLEAIEQCRNELPDLIVSDICMPIMNGVELCEQLKGDVQTSHIPIILFSGLDTKEDIIAGLEAGADDYIVKPFEFDILLKKISTIFANRQVLFKKFIMSSDDNAQFNSFESEIDNQWISDVTAYIDSRIEDPELTPNDLYKQFNMSRSSFYHKTKTLIDLAPLELIRMVRLKKAKQILDRGCACGSISDLAYNVGFNDPKYFSAIFKRQFGQTPSTYLAARRKHSETNTNLNKETDD